jgi:hypothetical protein
MADGLPGAPTIPAQLGSRPIVSSVRKQPLWLRPAPPFERGQRRFPACKGSVARTFPQLFKLMSSVISTIATHAIEPRLSNRAGLEVLAGVGELVPQLPLLPKCGVLVLRAFQEEHSGLVAAL